nr:DUF447 domain-containing protein [Metallosphaera hakonensis]
MPYYFFKGLSGQLSPERWVYGLPAINGMSCIFVAKCKLTALGNPSEFLLSFISEMGECKEKSLSRGDGLFVDLLVHITRVDIVSKDERDKLFEIIKYETEVIRRTAPYLEPFLKRIEDSLRSKGYKLE